MPPLASARKEVVADRRCAFLCHEVWEEGRFVGASDEAIQTYEPHQQPYSKDEVFALPKIQNIDGTFFQWHVSQRGLDFEGILLPRTSTTKQIWDHGQTVNALLSRRAHALLGAALLRLMQVLKDTRSRILWYGTKPPTAVARYTIIVVGPFLGV
jgi:hypothetical protein